MRARVPVYRVTARNVEPDSPNKMHDDAVARRYGFAGGLVPGVTVFGYLVHPVAALWGRPWVERGTLSARFLTPAYDGDELLVELTADGEDALQVSAVKSDGTVCATGRATLPAEAGLATDIAYAPPAPLVPAEPAYVGALDVLSSLEATYDRDERKRYLAQMDDDLPLFADGTVGHPGWLVRYANYLLMAAVDLPPWIHVASEVTNHGVLAEGETVSVRGRVVATFKHKGHEFVELDVLMLAGGRTLQSVRHTAIYRPRTPSPE
ncbi:MAG: hypothetical protein NVSMB13_13800 [Mycobacteriales bacterium]